MYYGPKGTLETVRRKVGYVFQYAALFDSLNVLGNVTMGLHEDDLAGMKRAEIARRVWDTLEIVNLEPREILNKIPSELSGGMKKRVGIARAIVARPEILLWDEPTTGLDPVNTAAIERLIQRLSKELEVTSLLVTHDVEGGLRDLRSGGDVGRRDAAVLRYAGGVQKLPGSGSAGFRGSGGRRGRSGHGGRGDE